MCGDTYFPRVICTKPTASLCLLSCLLEDNVVVSFFLYLFPIHLVPASTLIGLTPEYRFYSFNWVPVLSPIYRVPCLIPAAALRIRQLRINAPILQKRKWAVREEPQRNNIMIDLDLKSVAWSWVNLQLNLLLLVNSLESVNHNLSDLASLTLSPLTWTPILTNCLPWWTHSSRNSTVVLILSSQVKQRSSWQWLLLELVAKHSISLCC